MPANLQGKKSWSAEGELERFMSNKDDQEFIDRVKGLERACRQCFKPGALLFVKVQDTRDDGYLVLNHVMVIENLLPSFRPYALFVYLKSGGQTWKHHSETSHGFYVVMKYVGSGDGERHDDGGNGNNTNRNSSYRKKQESLPNHAVNKNLEDFC